MPETLLLDITLVILLGVGAQWVARRFQLPSILLLLVIGFLAGPALGLLSPEALQADWYYAFVSLAVGLLLFDAGLNLRFSDLLEVKTPVFRVLLLGGLITLGLGAAAAHFLLGFEGTLSLLLGLLLSISGPAVTLPLLRHARPKSRVGALARWEGFAMEPIGAILAVLMLDALLLLNRPSSAASEVSSVAERLAIGLGLDIFIALGVSVAATGLLILFFRRHAVPNSLRTPVILTVVLAAFVVSNVLQEESGLLTTTLMGIFFVNQPYVSVHRSLFKGKWHVLLVGSLFVLLSAKLEMSALDVIDVRVLVFLVFLVVLVRPLAIFFSTLGTSLQWEEKTFMAWVGPPGGIAAALASLFAYRLLPMYPQEISGMVPIAFTVIVGMGALYGLTLSPMARWLEVATPTPQGLLFVGAGGWVRTVAQCVQQLGIPVLLLDDTPRHVYEAREEGLPARLVRQLSNDPHDDLDLSSVGRLLIAVPHDEVAALTALHFSDVFDPGDIYHLPAQMNGRSGDSKRTVSPLYGRPLFGESTTYPLLQKHVEHGGEVKILKVATDFPQNGQKEYYTYDELVGQYEEHTVIPLFIFRGRDTLEIVSETSQFYLRPDDRLIALVGARPTPENGDAAESNQQAALEVEEALPESEEEDDE